MTGEQCQEKAHADYGPAWFSRHVLATPSSHYVADVSPDGGTNYLPLENASVSPAFLKVGRYLDVSPPKRKLTTASFPVSTR